MYDILTFYLAINSWIRFHFKLITDMFDSSDALVVHLEKLCLHCIRMDLGLENLEYWI